jgi:hypothetical protein
MELNDYFQNQSVLKTQIKMKSESMIRNQSELIKSKRRGNFLFRQELSDWTVNFSIKCSLLLNTALFIFFSIFGIYIAVTSGNVYQVFVEYDNW